MENEVQQVIPSVKPLLENQTPVPTPPSTNWSNILLFTILGLIVVAGLVLAGIQIGKSQTSIQQPAVEQQTISPTQTAVNPTDLPVTPSPTTDPTADWKTYKNIALGFEIKYPPNVEIILEENDQHNRITIFKGESLNFEVDLHKAGDTPLDKYYYMDNPVFTKSVLDDKIANVYIFDASKNSCVSNGSGPGCTISYVTYVAQNGLDLYHLSFKGDSILSDTEKNILSTFKFTN